MNNDHIFISHATIDNEFVRDLRLALEGLKLKVWEDNPNLRTGDELEPEIVKAIENSRHFIVVLSQAAIKSDWVKKEIQKAQQVKKDEKKKDYRIIPLLLPDVDIELFKSLSLFEEELIARPVNPDIEGLIEAMPDIMAALRERLPSSYKQTIREVVPKPIKELLLKLSNPSTQISEGKRLVTATAILAYETDKLNEKKESKEFTFTAPLGPIESEELRWYLESYHIWPVGVFKERAERIEDQLPEWGQDLYNSALKVPEVQDVLKAWLDTKEDAERRFSIFVDAKLPEGTEKEKQIETNEAASLLLSLPWELLHDGRSYLFQGRNRVRVRRCLPDRPEQDGQQTPEIELPIHILLVSPRPEDEYTHYFDHRSSALPLVQAMEKLGDLVELTILEPPTCPALRKALKDAEKDQFDVVHFDGHGVFSKEYGLGGLCFEDPVDTQILFKRKPKFVDAKEISAIMREYRIPLVFLDACQTGRVEGNPTASVAVRLLEDGVSSVVAMSYSVLVETARRFVQAFYKELAEGSRVGNAMIEGQSVLEEDTYRGKLMGAGDLQMKDWFVPVMYQEKNDPQLVKKIPEKDAQQLQIRKHRRSMGYLPETPPHTFVGRSRELLALERLLHNQNYAVIRGQGGAGKTALAVELARWLVKTDRYDHVAFVSMETYTDARGIVNTLGHQLLPEGDKWSVSSDLDKDLQHIERALIDHTTIIVIDNLESVLPNSRGEAPAGVIPVEELFDLCNTLLDFDPDTRIVFTSREALPEPFDSKGCEIVLGALSREDAIELVSRVMANEGLTPKATDPGGTPQEITDLVEAVNRHARALVLLAKEVSRQGVKSTTDNLHRIMAQLHRKYPDDREQSLYASVELSLRRLSPEVREQIKPLAVFHSGVNLVVLSLMTGMESDAVQNLFGELIGVGLAEDMGYGHLRLDPALSPYLQGEIPEAELEGMKTKWDDGMMQLTDFLYGQRFRDANLASGLTLLELPNLMMMLDQVQDKESPERVVYLARNVEALLEYLGRLQPLAYATSVREKAAEKLVVWSHARFEAERVNIDRLIERGDLQSAYNIAQGLLKRCLDAGEGAYQDADYDIAMAYIILGRVLRFSGAAEAALSPLADAQVRFQKLADAGGTSAEHMASASITERANCLTALGRLDEAEDSYENAIGRFEKLDDRRWIAVSKSSLGTVRRRQGRYRDAIEIYNEARDTFERLGELGTVAIIWHQIGMVYKNAGQFESAEQAYRRALAIRVQQKDRAMEAGDMGELGNLYDVMGRLKEAVTFYSQATDIYVKLQDLRYEGVARSNMARVLIKLKRYDEARRELARAIECREPYGHAAEPWKTYAILYNLEQATGNTDAAKQAQEKAIETYLAYCRAGGVSQSPLSEIYTLAIQAIKQGNVSQLERELAQLSGTVADPSRKALISNLRAILNGNRDPSLANDPALPYRDVAELMLLLESL